MWGIIFFVITMIVSVIAYYNPFKKKWHSPDPSDSSYITLHRL